MSVSASGEPVISDGFPRYMEFDPLVPIWCVTPAVDGCIHRFFDTSAISPSGRYLAAFALPFEDRHPEPGEAGQVVLVDLSSGEQQRVAESRGWEPQLGANVNWGGSDEELFFNDVDVATWEPFAVKLNPLTGRSERLGGTVYHASPDGRWLASADLRKMLRTQGGYGVMLPREKMPRNVGTREDDGVWLTSTATGQRKLAVSLAELMAVADSPNYGEPGGMEAYGFHSKFSPCGDRLLFTVRWCRHDAQRTGGRAFGLHDDKSAGLRYTVFTMSLGAVGEDGFPEVGGLAVGIGDEQWEKHGHHVNWWPDGSGLTANLRIDRGAMRFVRCGVDGSDLREVVPGAGVVGSGHPSVHPTAGHFLTDVYAHEPLAYGDGTTPLRWIDLASGSERTVARFPTETPEQLRGLGALRVDPHPAWDRTWTHVAFNAYFGGTRRVMVADMRRLIEGRGG